MEERYIASVDLGTSKIALAVSRIDGDNAQVIYFAQTPSDGVRYSYVFNPGLASEPVVEAIRKAEEALKIKIFQVVTVLPRYSVKQESAPGRLERSDPESCISQEEISFLKTAAMDDYPLADDKKEMVYGAVAQSFTTDDLIRCPERDVVGAVSDELEGNFKIFVGRKKWSENLEKSLRQSGVSIARLYFSPDVTADAVLTEEEKENGVALVEIGAGVTSVTIYQNNLMRHYGAIPFGAGNITSDIKYECGFSNQLSENLKLAYGACMPEKLQTLGEKTLQINDDDLGSYKHLPVKYLSEIITARQKEIFNAILYEIGMSGYSDRLRNGVVLTGGGALLANCANLLKEMSGYNVRVGYPRQKHFSAGENTGILTPGACASVGMLLRAKGDRLLNCIQEPPAKEDEEPVKPEPVATEGGSNLFEDETVLVGKTDEKPREKSRRSEKKGVRIQFLSKIIETGEKLFADAE